VLGGCAAAALANALGEVCAHVRPPRLLAGWRAPPTHGAGRRCGRRRPSGGRRRPGPGQGRARLLGACAGGDDGA